MSNFWKQHKQLKEIIEKTSKAVVVKNILFLFLLGFITWVFKTGLDTSLPTDPIQKLSVLSVETNKEFVAFAAKVNVGMLVKSFPTFELQKNNFVIDVIVWFEYDPDKVMLETLSQFSFENGDIIKRSSPDIRIKNGKVMVKYDVRISFKSSLAYKKFPLEDHRISIVLTNNFATPREIFFVVEDSSFQADPNIFIPDWKIKNLTTEAGFLELGLDYKDPEKSVSAPKVRFTIDLDKKGYKDAFIIFVPLYLAIFLSMYSFLTSILAAQQRTVMAAAAAPALLGYRFVIQNMMPVVAYFTTTDYIYLILLLCAFLIFVFQLIFSRKAITSVVAIPKTEEEKGRRDFYENINTAAYIFIVFFLAFFSYYFVMF